MLGGYVENRGHRSASRLTTPAVDVATLMESRTKSTNGASQAADRARRTAVELQSRHSIDILRVSVGLVFLGFGVLKFFPGVSPAEELAVRTLETLSFGMVSGPAALLMTAIIESFTGLTMVTGKLLQVGLVVKAGAMVGILSPLVLFFGDRLVIAARVLGARLVPGEPSPAGTPVIV